MTIPGVRGRGEGRGRGRVGAGGEGYDHSLMFRPKLSIFVKVCVVSAMVPFTPYPHPQNSHAGQLQPNAVKATKEEQKESHCRKESREQFQRSSSTKNIN